MNNNEVICSIKTKTGNSCKNKPKTGSNICTYHLNRRTKAENEEKSTSKIEEDSSSSKSSVNKIICQGRFWKNRKKIKCNKRTKCGSDYCDRHSKIYRLSAEENCPICLEAINLSVEIPLECGHWMHMDCLIKCKKAECPVCRKVLTINEMEAAKKVKPTPQINKAIYTLGQSLSIISADLIRFSELRRINPILESETTGNALDILSVNMSSQIYEILRCLGRDTSLIRNFDSIRQSQDYITEIAYLFEDH